LTLNAQETSPYFRGEFTSSVNLCKLLTFRYYDLSEGSVIVLIDM
jgi:hypothetical protein